MTLEEKLDHLRTTIKARSEKDAVPLDKVGTQALGDIGRNCLRGAHEGHITPQEIEAMLLVLSHFKRES